MGGHKLRVGILTSSRADFGIYLPLLRRMSNDKAVQFDLIVFGSHLSTFHGMTKRAIEANGFNISYEINGTLVTDDPDSIAVSYGLHVIKFSEFWKNHGSSFDVVIAIGDRYEMAAAVAASIPFGLKIAHIHAGETSLGAIDNIYRHSISLASKFHFTATNQAGMRVHELLGEAESVVVNSGALSLENVKDQALMSIEEFKNKWDIDFNISTILVTIHPETISHSRNGVFAEIAANALKTLSIDHQLIITMPNADTFGTVYREAWQKIKLESSNVFLIENLGTPSYFAAMAYSKLLIGNTSSGIIEAASFKKYVLNLGNRQNGRLSGENVIHISFDEQEIVKKANEFIGREYEGNNIYYKENTSQLILDTLKSNL